MSLSRPVISSLSFSPLLTLAVPSVDCPLCLPPPRPPVPYQRAAACSRARVPPVALLSVPEASPTPHCQTTRVGVAAQPAASVGLTPLVQMGLVGGCLSSVSCQCLTRASAALASSSRYDDILKPSPTSVTLVLSIERLVYFYFIFIEPYSSMLLLYGRCLTNECASVKFKQN